MANEQNLIPYWFTSNQSREEAAKNGALGGVASGAARRRKRSLREAADLYLSLPPSDMNVWNSLCQNGVEPEEIDNQMAVIAGLTMKAVAGDSKAAKVLFDIIGDEEKGGSDAAVNIIIDV